MPLSGVSLAPVVRGRRRSGVTRYLDLLHLSTIT
jgi:hypothetical protein